METADEQVIQLREDEQEPDGEVFLGEEPSTELFTSDAPAEDDGTVREEFIGTIDVAAASLPQAADAIAQAVRDLDAERAGDAAKPEYQPSIPGILPPFDWRSAQLTTESLETNVAEAEDAWDAAKEEAASCKKTFDKTVEQLRAHIQSTHRARVDAEYQHGKGTGPIAAVPDPETVKAAASCWTEQKTGRPCSICRNLLSAPTNSETAQHVAAAAAVDANAGTLDAAGMAASIGAVTGVVVTADDLAAWTADDFKTVALYLEVYTASPFGVPADRPAILGRPHEAGEDGITCRICGASLPVPADQDGFVAGLLIGLDCAGEAAEPAPKATPRHRKPADRQKAKQARGSKDHAAEQKAEGTKKAASEKSKKKTAGKKR